MGLQPNRPLTATATRPGGLFALLGSWLSNKPTGGAAAPAAPQPSVIDLLDKLNLAGQGSAQAGLSALSEPQAQQAFQQLRQPGQATHVTPAGWQALAKQWVGLSAASRAQLTSALKSAGVSTEMGADGRYVSFRTNDVRVIAEPTSQRIRRTEGDTVLGYQGTALAVAMTIKGDTVDVTTRRSGRQTWQAGVGQGFQDGLPIIPRMARVVPGEAPREPWASALSNDLAEPAWASNTRMDAYAPAYDAAIAQMGGTVLEPADAAARAADLYNCHSFATTGGQGDLFDPFLRESHPHWLNNPMYRLTNGPFAQLQASQRVHPGDVIVYRKEGKATHTGIVREVDGQGNPKLIESKFGVLGRYLHEPFDVPAQYGAPGEYFRPEGA